MIVLGAKSYGFDSWSGYPGKVLGHLRNNMKEKGDRIYNKALRLATEDKPNNYQVLDLLQRASDLGNSKAKFALGNWHIHGKILDKNPRKAFGFFLDSADSNNSESCLELGKCYELGHGTKRNFREAFNYYLKAALLGNDQAIYEVGRCFYYGIGVNRSIRIANVILDIAELKGIEN